MSKNTRKYLDLVGTYIASLLHERTGRKVTVLEAGRSLYQFYDKDEQTMINFLDLILFYDWLERGLDVYEVFPDMDDKAHQAVLDITRYLVGRRSIDEIVIDVHNGWKHS
ncbi:MAG: hypothetical protein EOP45_23060 [Sphingobacteriaceae bacterium]|nr:MAG: hypothetical protein EOP45_23060 [Sphingobacteriaceae bacterium]